MNKVKTAVLISGRGSNLKALIEACNKPDFPAEIVLVLSNKGDAPGLDIATEAGLKTAVVEHKAFPTREVFEAVVERVLKGAGAELVCLAGFMRVLTADFVNRWPDRILNIHPSLLPAFKGLDTHARALKAGVRFTGCTVHFVRPETDDGPIIIQAVIPVAAGDTAEALSKKVLACEHKAYPEALRLVASGRARVVDGVVEIKDGKAPAVALVNPALD